MIVENKPVALILALITLLALISILVTGVDVLDQQTTLIAVGLGSIATGLLIWRRPTAEAYAFAIAVIMVVGSHIVAGLLVLLLGTLIGLALHVIFGEPLSELQQSPAMRLSISIPRAVIDHHQT